MEKKSREKRKRGDESHAQKSFLSLYNFPFLVITESGSRLFWTKFETTVLLKVHVPPSVHGNNGVALLHSPGVVQFSPKRSSSATEVASRGVSSSPSDVSPCGSPVKKFAAASSNERNSKPTPTQLPWTHIKIQTQPKGNNKCFRRVASSVIYQITW